MMSISMALMEIAINTPDKILTWLSLARLNKRPATGIDTSAPAVISSATRNTTNSDFILSWNSAEGGAYKVESWKPGTETIYVRNDDWKCGPLPKVRRIVSRIVPAADLHAPPRPTRARQRRQADGV